MGSIDQTASLAELVAERPSRARFFERLRLDYCCGGSQSLADACRDRGLDAGTVGELLEALDEDGPRADPPEERDWRQASIGELCDHILSAHHEGLRRELPQISELLATVVRVHGEGRDELEEAQLVFAGIRGELEHHLELEERELVPAIRALEADGPAAAAIDGTLIDRHEAEHLGVGEGLVRLRDLGNGYDTSAALCGTHRALLDALLHFESDLHQHVHEENNILFPRVRELAGLAAGQGTRSSA
jgi:regulator of cell morphogenesis and NO signaling